MRGLTLCLLAVMLACGTDPPENTPLTMDEAIAFFDGAGTVWNNALNIATPTNPSVTQDCPKGGTVNVTFTATETSGNVVIKSDGCRFTASGHTFTADGAPSVTLLVEFEPVGDEYRVTAKVTGAFDWMLEHRSGKCSINLSGETIAPEPEDAQLEFAGTLCDHRVTALGE